MILKQIIKHLILISFISLLTFNNLNAKEYFIQLKNNKDSSLFLNYLKKDFLNNDFSEFYYKKAFKSLKYNGLDRVFVVNFNSKFSNEEILLLSKHPLVSFIELVPEYEFFHTPNDFSTSSMWHLDKIKARDAWDIEKGGKNILIAIVDDGIDTTHSEFQSSIWKNNNEIANNGIDDDNNGYVDDIFGWDMADNDNNPSVTSANNLSHGTHCAGIAAARTNNNNGISSISYSSKIMTIKCGRNGSSQIFNPYQGVEYAIENGARIISMSWGGGSYSYVYELIFAEAAQRDIICIAAAGNSNTNFKMYPAGYNNVIAVGSTTSTDAKSSFSNYGNWIDVMAPGSSIYSTIPGNTYATYSGTSMACPLVSGLCALMLSKNPYYTAIEIEQCLKNTCDNIDNANQSYIGAIGSGRINALQALKCVKGVKARFNSSKTFVCTNDTIHFKDQTIPTPNSWYWEFPGGTPNVSTNQNPIVRYSTNGTYNVKLTVINGNDTDVYIKNNYINVGSLEARFSGVQTINNGEYATIKVDITGKAPWTLIYKGNNQTDTIKNILSSPHFILKQPDSSIVYKPISVSSNNCLGQVKDSTKITVINNSGGGGNMICDSSLRFHATFGGNGDDQLYDLQIFNDSTIYVVGRTTTVTKGNYDGYIAKLKIDGSVLWSKSIGGTSEESLWAIKVDKYENVYCGGVSYSNVTNRAAFMLKIDKNGNLKWKKYFHGGVHEYIYNLTLSTNHDFLYYVGHCNYNGYGSSDNCIFKLDSSGNVDWVKQIGSAGQERPYSVTVDNNNNAYVSGIVFPGSVPDGSIIKIASNGTINYYNKYVLNTSNNYSEFMDISNYDNRHLYIVGRSINSGIIRLFLMKTALNGTVIWTKYFYSGSHNNPKIKILNKKIFILDRSVISSKTNGHLFAFDTTGNLLTSKLISHPNQNVYAYGFDFNSKEEIYYSGYQLLSNNQFMIGKLNCKNENICLTSNLTPTINNTSFTSSTFSYSSQNINNQATTSHSLTDYSINTINYNCKSNANITKTKCNLKADFTFVNTCARDSVKFYGTLIDSNNFNIKEYYWNFGNNSQLSKIQNPLVLYKETGNYTVQLIATSSNGFQTCSDTVSKELQINNDIKIITFPNNPSICIGDSLQIISPFITCGNQPYEYEWLPNTNINNNKILNPYFSPKTTTTYTLTVKDKNGIWAKDSFTITVKTDCCKSIARFETNKENICTGDSITLKNTSNYEANSVFFKWTINGASISSYVGKVPPPFKITGNNASITLELSDICSNDTALQSYFIFPLPSINFQKTFSICRQDTLQLGEETFGRNSYQWSPNLGLNNSNISNPIAIVNQTIQYKLNVTDEFGCINNDSIKITNYSIPKFSLGNDTGFCKNSLIQLKAPLSSDEFTWNNGAKTPIINVTSSGLYWLRINNNYCSLSDSIEIEEYILPQFKINTSSSTYCKTPIVLSPNKTFSNATYLWNNGSTNSAITIQKSGKYLLTITDNNQCRYKDSVQINQGQLPVIDGISDTTICENTSIMMTAPNIPNQTYIWNNTQSGQSYLITRQGNYTLKTSTNCGDTTIAFKVITEDCNCYLWIPNAFTPNNDQINETFSISSSCPLIEFDFKIYNHWGELVYQTKDPNFIWNGQYKNELMPLGVYFYVTKYRKVMNNLQLYEEQHGFINLKE